MTETEAKTKWCPMVRTGLTAGMSVNRHVADARGAMDGVHDETRCIGSECMMWREYRGNGWCGLAGINYNNGRRRTETE
jgi:hypothetical protein